MNTNEFSFIYTHEVELPCGNTHEFSYLVEAQPVPQYSTNDFTGVDEFVGVTFDVLAADLILTPTHAESVSLFKPGEDMRRFRQTLADAARDHYERRHGYCDFETVTIHDRVAGQDVTVYDNIQTV